ncbi:MAG: CoA-binding protein [Deltaproteobacteria bacterium]|nr:CoA-binding protein [Deltaproteobacteria bacterium]MBW1909847.1 CoA-binding protein [Deltaproteobacteria bacterium]MBW2115429.1 CoA-binding protein [Deltaproteobacteria bacterium]
MKQTDHFLDRFFNPESVAIVGATNNPFKMNFRILENLVNLNFKGRIYPVNRHSKEILGIKVFPRLQDIKDRIDLVVTAVPASKTMDIVKECDSIGVKHLVIITGGFSEGGNDGKKLHHEIGSFVKDKSIRTLGPNTLSPINTANNMVISFNPIKKLRRGGLSFAFQSGLYEPKLNWLFSHLGINKMLDMGNKMDINEVDALEYFSKDPDTRVIAMHIESLHGNGRDFFNLLESVCREKPVIILKSGRTHAGSRAAASHTGSMSKENDLIFDSVIKQAGAIRACNLEDFFDLAKAFEFLELPHGNRLAIINLSGGEGVMATDACEMNGLKLARLSDRTHKKLKAVFPPWEIPLNPFDAGVCMEFHLSDLKMFFDNFSAIPEDENVDCTIMQMPPNLSHFISSSQNVLKEKASYLTEQYIELILNMRGSGKPFAMWCSSMDTREAELIELVESHSLPVFQSSERAIKSLSAMYLYKLRKLSND